MRRAMQIGLAGLLLVGCGGSSFPPPHNQMAAAQQEVGRAQEAANNPTSRLHLQLAQESLSQADQLIGRDNRRAATLIARGRAEAEYATILSRQAQAKSNAQMAAEELKRLKGGN